MILKEYSLSNKRLTEFIKGNKFLNDSKYYKNNVWSLAAFDSWAANGQAGGCSICKNKYYNASLENKRRPKAGSTFKWKCNEIFKVCSRCKYAIEENIEYKFNDR